jgi:hypothetical protein
MSRAILEEDFLAPAIASPHVLSAHTWVYGGTGAGTPQAPVSTSGSPGILRLLTGTSNNDEINLSLGGNGAGPFLPNDVQRFKIRLSAGSLTSCRMLWGLGENIDSDTFGSDGFYFIFDTAVDATVRAVTRSAGVQTSVSTTITMSAQLTSYEFVRVSASLWHAFITDSGGARRYVTSHTLNLPTTQTMTMGVRLVTLTGSSRTADIDLISLQTRDLTLR